EVPVRHLLHPPAELLARPQADRALVLDHVPRGVGAAGAQALSTAFEGAAFAAPAPPAAEKQRRWLRPSLVVLALVLAVGGVVGWAVASLGTWLVVADPLERSTAVVVLSGYMPYRAIEAAAIYRKGWAQEVWLTEWSQTRLRADLARLGISMPR